MTTVRCCVEGQEFYVHSNNNPSMEGYILANSWYNKEKNKYIVYGLGLGYHIKQLCECSAGATIEVYEGNLNMLQLATKFGVIGDCLSTNQVSIHYDPMYKELTNRIRLIDDKTELVVFQPSIRMIEHGDIREKIEDYFLRYNSIKNQRTMLYDNFRINQTLCSQVVDSLKSQWKGKNVYIVAAGPSLDINFKALSKVESGSNGYASLSQIYYWLELG